VNVACVGICFACCPKSTNPSDNMEYDSTCHVSHVEILLSSGLFCPPRHLNQAGPKQAAKFFLIGRVSSDGTPPSAPPRTCNHGLFTIAMIKPRDSECQDRLPHAYVSIPHPLLANSGMPKSDEYARYETRKSDMLCSWSCPYLAVPSAPESF